MKTKIFLATNGLCATKFVISMQKKKVEFYGMATHEDLMANYAYIPYLKKYKIVESGGGEKNFCNLKLIEELVNEFQCDFVFCGYGHSSENPMISKIFNDKFMGPSYVSMAFLTDKLVSTVIANSLGIPVTKFYTNFDTNWILKGFENVKDHFSKNSLFDLPELTIFDDKLKLKEKLLKTSCLKIEKFPLFLKITNSGGGKGIFLINSIEELREKLMNNYQKHSFIHFRNDEVFTENTRISKQYFLTEVIDDARHIEVQILADKYFNIFVLGGRECSNQRRRQKLIETSLEFDGDFTEEIFLKMCLCARKLVKSVGYYGLATVEFLFSKNQFYFLEVNCRIQVEHPITELIYGLNLPYLLYRVAKNEKIFLSITEKFKYVMGIRITAETNDFLPSTGKVNVISNPLKCKTYFSTFNGIIDKNSDSHFGYIFSFNNNRAKMIKNLLKDVNNLKIEGVCTPLLKLASFIKDQKYNKSVFELEKYTFHQKEENLYIIFACIIYFDKNKQEKNIRYLYNQNIFTFTIYDLTDKLFVQNKNTFLILEYSFSSKKLILFFKDRSELLNYEVENECYKFRGKIFSTKFNIVKSEISGKVVEILENQVIIESMKVRHIIKIPDNVVLLIKKEDMISVGDDFYKTNETFQNKEIKLKNELQIDLLEEASVFGKDIPFEFINKPIKPIEFYISNNTNNKLVNYLLNLKETKETTFCVLMNFIFRFLKESCKNRTLIYELLEERKEFFDQKNNLFVELLKCFFTNKNLEFKFEEKSFDEKIHFHKNCLIHKIFNHSSEILFFFENILLEIQNFLRILNIKEVKLLKNDFVYFIKINEFLETKLIHKDEVLSYKVNLKEMKNKTNFIKSNKFIDLLQFYSAELNEEIEIYELFLEESFEKKEEMICQKFLLTYSNELNYKLTTKVSEEISMKGYLIHFKEMYCVFIVNNKEHKNGSFGIKEDILFYLLSKFARKNLLPKIFVSNNSGARIGVVSDLLNKLELKKNDLFIKENSCEKDKSVCMKNVGIQVTDKYLAYNNKILSIFGNKDTGPENLSYCTLTAKESIKCYDTTLTLSYVQNMSVGIGAYLSKLSYRIIQKENTCIILTGYKALNKILKKEVYKNNLELGGDSVYKSNLMIDSFVQDDFEGIKEIFFMCEIFYKSRKRRNFYKEIKENTKKLQLEEYFCKYFNENHTELEIIELLLDSFQEYNSNYGKGVRVVRGFYKDRSIGVISAIETNLTKEICEKISDTIEKFNKEGLDMLIIANWAGFTSTKEELQGNIISFGAKIINQLVKFKQRILVYLPPFSLLKGGSYVCFDKRINKRLKMFVHPTSKITILDAEGVSEVKLKNINQKEIIFCEKHECVYRMVRNKIVDDVLLVYELQSVLERMLFCKDW